MATDPFAPYLAMAELQGAGTAAPGPSQAVKGRFMTKLLDKALAFWSRHRATLVPYLEAAAVAALDYLVANLATINAINPPGPE